MNRIITITFTLSLLLLTTVSHGGMHVETFSDFSHYDPYMSTALWNTSSNRLEINPVQGTLTVFPFDMAADGNGGYYHAFIDSQSSFSVLILQHYDADGFPTLPVPGVVIVSEITFFTGDISVLTNGDILVTWSQYNDPVIHAQRFNSNAEPVWPAPLQVNYTPIGSSVSRVKTAPLPGNNAVICFIDNREGINKAFAQRIDGSGTRQWPGDVKLQSDNAFVENSIEVVTSDAGMIFACFIQDDGDISIGLTWLTMNGVVSWDPAIIANKELTLDQRNPTMCLINNTEIYIAWTETDGTRFYADIQHWHDDGTCDYADDLRFISQENPIGKMSLNTMNSDTILASLTISNPDISLLANVIFQQDLSILGPASAVVPPASEETIVTYTVATSPNGGAFYAYTAISSFLMNGYTMQVGNIGQPLWPEPRRINLPPHEPFQLTMQFTKNSGNQTGFKYYWIDNRAHNFHGFATEFNSPLHQLYVPKQIDSTSQLMGAKTVQAADGSCVAVWYTRESNQRRLEAMWYDDQWDPIWSQPVIIETYTSGSGLTSFDLDMNNQDQVCITWTHSNSTDAGVYLQTFTRQRQQVYPTPIKVDMGIPASFFDNAKIVPGLTDGVLIAWQDNTTGPSLQNARKFNNAGNPTWAVPLQIPMGATDTLLQYDLVQDNSSYCIVYGVRDGSGYAIHRARFDDTGSFLEIPQIISANYEYIHNVAADVMNSDIYIIWDAEQSANISVFGQKLVGGFPVWIDKNLSSTTYNSVDFLDIITTSSNSLSYAFQGWQSTMKYNLIQQIDSSGNTELGAEQTFLIPKPAVYDFEYGISSMLNSGETIHWASVASTQDDPRGGDIQYWLSNNGGTTWIQTQVGLPVVFPSPGTDLRCSADLYAEPHQQVSPEVTSITTIWNETQIGTDLVLNQNHFFTGDTFRLAIRHSNSGTSKIVDKYLLLDVYNQYWWWPSWSETIDSSNDSISSGYTEDIIFEFSWPADTGSAYDLRFWTALLEPGTSNLVGPWDYVTFGYGP